MGVNDNGNCQEPKIEYRGMEQPSKRQVCVSKKTSSGELPDRMTIKYYRGMEQPSKRQVCVGKKTSSGELPDRMTIKYYRGMEQSGSSSGS